MDSYYIYRLINTLYFPPGSSRRLSEEEVNKANSDVLGRTQGINPVRQIDAARIMD